jgi:urease accessory protein
MFAATSWSEPQRSRGALRLGFERLDGRTRLARRFEQGCAKVRLPRGSADAILINTAGGLTGGDRLSIDAAAGEGARGLLTTQACERVYRAAAGEAAVDIRLSVGAGGRLDWLPQETILFDRGRLARTLAADLAGDAALLVCEAVIFGRKAMGEVVATGFLHDRWRVRRDGRLVLAEDFRLDGAVAATLARPAVLAGAGACATLALFAPDAERHLDPVRAVVEPLGAASAWDDKLVARIVAPDGLALRRTLLPLLAIVLGRPLPRVWTL